MSTINSTGINNPIPLSKNDMAYKLNQRYGKPNEKIPFNPMKFDSVEFSRYAVVQNKIDNAIFKGEPLADDVTFEEFYTYGKLNQEREFMSNIGYDMSFIKEDLTKEYYSRGVFDLLTKGVDSIISDKLYHQNDIMQSIMELPIGTAYDQIFSSDVYKEDQADIISRFNSGETLTKIETLIMFTGENRTYNNFTLSEDTLRNIREGQQAVAPQIDEEMRIDFNIDNDKNSDIDTEDII